MLCCCTPRARCSVQNEAGPLSAQPNCMGSHASQRGPGPALLSSLSQIPKAPSLSGKLCASSKHLTASHFCRAWQGCLLACFCSQVPAL